MDNLTVFAELVEGESCDLSLEDEHEVYMCDNCSSIFPDLTSASEHIVKCVCENAEPAPVESAVAEEMTSATEIASVAEEWTSAATQVLINVMKEIGFDNAASTYQKNKKIALAADRMAELGLQFGFDVVKEQWTSLKQQYIEVANGNLGDSWEHYDDLQSILGNQKQRGRPPSAHASDASGTRRSAITSMLIDAVQAVCFKELDGHHVRSVTGSLRVTLDDNSVFVVKVDETLAAPMTEKTEAMPSVIPSTPSKSMTQNAVVSPHHLHGTRAAKRTAASAQSEVPTKQAANLLPLVNGADSSRDAVHVAIVNGSSFDSVNELSNAVLVDEKSSLSSAGNLSSGGEFAVGDVMAEAVDASMDCHSIKSEPVDIEFSGLDDVCNSLNAAATFLHKRKIVKTKASGNTCSKCSKVFMYKQSLARHNCKMTQGRLRGTFKCSLCDQSFVSRNQLYHHRQQTHRGQLKVKRYYDPTVNTRRIARIPSLVTEEQRKKLGTETFDCNDCGKPCKSLHMLVVHCLRKHARVVNLDTGEQVFLCVYCEMQFPTLTLCKAHRLDAHPTDPIASLTCRDCGIKCDKRSLLSSHFVMCHRPFTCEVCGVETYGRRGFVEHVKTEHPSVSVRSVWPMRRYCEHCGAEFESDAQLRDHINYTHFNQPQKCPICDKVLSSEKTLNIHMRLHRPECYRTCDLCGKQFSRLAGLVEHLRSHHPAHVPEKYRQVYRCTVCAMTFSRRPAVARHMLDKHELVRHDCAMCGKRFGYRRGMLRHMRKDHNINTSM